MLTNKSPLFPSITSLYYGLYYFLATHPLLNSNLILHPITEEPIEINRYRLMGGFPVSEGLTCSIYPLFDSEDNALCKANSVSSSVLYKPYNLGASNEDEAIYHFVIDYSYREVNFDGLNQSEDDYLIKVPKDHYVYPDELGIISYQDKDIDLYVNPPLDIVANYLELTRLALCDTTHHTFYPVGKSYRSTLDKVTFVHMNFPTLNWDKNTNVIDCRGYLLIALDAYVTRDWRKMWTNPIEEITINKKFN